MSQKKTCQTCVLGDDYVIDHEECWENAHKDECPNWKHQTNRNRLRVMTEDELVELWEMVDNPDAFRAWLREEWNNDDN